MAACHDDVAVVDDALLVLLVEEQSPCLALSLTVGEPWGECIEYGVTLRDVACGLVSSLVDGEG